jgi:hypothetical protein
MTIRRMFGILGMLVAALAATAQDKPDEKQSQKVPSTFRAYLVVDKRFPAKTPPPVKPQDRDPRDRTDKMHCLVCDNGLSPVVAIFVRADAKGLARDTSGVVKLAKRVDALIPKYRADKLAGFIIFLKTEGPPKPPVKVAGTDDSTKPVELDAEYPDDEKRDEYAREINDVAAAANTPNIPFGLAPATSKAATAWGIKPDDEVTVIIYNRLRIEGRWVFKGDGPDDKEIETIIAATKKMLPPLLDE